MSGVLWESANCGDGLHPKTQGRAGRWGRVVARQITDALTGQRRLVYWPGKGLGVRPPDEDETPLSGFEVEFACRRRML